MDSDESDEDFDIDRDIIMRRFHEALDVPDFLFSDSSDIDLAEVMSFSESASDTSDDADNQENNDGHRRSYSLRSRSRNGGNVAPTPPSRISNRTISITSSDTEMESVSGDDDENASEPTQVESSGSENIDPSSCRLPLSELASSQQVADQLKDDDTSPKAKKNKKSSNDDLDADDGMTCSVCLDNFTNAGPHRLVSLRCGHIFGNSCVERWLKSGCMGGARRCPTCNKKANLKDIRVIYARKLQALDTSDKERLQIELDKVKEEKARLEIDMTKVKLNCDMQKRTIEALQKQILYFEAIKSKSGALPIQDYSFSQRSSNDLGCIKLLNTIDLKNNGSCRVLSFSPTIGLLVASQKSNISLFPGFGIRKIDSLDFRPTTYVHLHSSMIRDLAFHSQDANLLLSVSLDRTAKIFDNVSNSVVQTFKSDTLLWSCEWDASNPHRFMTGSQNGIVKIYDKRQTHEPVDTCVTVGDTTPVVSLSSIPPTTNTVLEQGGFLSCRLNSVYGYNGTSPTSNLVMLDGPFISLNYSSATQLILASTRPSGRFPNTRHILNQLAANGEGNFSNNIHVFNRENSGQVMMSRSCQLLMPDSDVWVGAYNESKHAVELLSVNKNDAVHRIPVEEMIQDLCPLKVNNSCFLGSLSANILFVHKIY